jgi:hypothetical protein
MFDAMHAPICEAPTHESQPAEMLIDTTSTRRIAVVSGRVVDVVQMCSPSGPHIRDGYYTERPVMQLHYGL